MNGKGQCALCGSRQATHFETIVDNSYTIVYIMCTECGLVRQWPHSSAAELRWFNQNIYRDGQSVEDIEKYEKLRAEVQFALLKGEIERPGNMLDIGCSTGELLSRFKGYWSSIDTWGVEPIEKVRTRAAEKGHKMLETIAATAISDTFDLITMSHVLEHVISPSQTLYSLRSVCKSDGKLFLEVPNLIDDLALEKAHLWAFTKGTITGILEASGWRVIWVKMHGAPKHPWLHAYLSVLAEPVSPFENSMWPSPVGIKAARARGKLKRMLAMATHGVENDVDSTYGVW